MATRWPPIPRLPWLLLASLAAMARPGLAHGAGGAGDAVQAAALPPWVLWAAGALVVALSFALVGLFLTRTLTPQPAAGDPIDAGDVTGLPQGLVGALRLVGLLVFAAIVAAAIVPWDPGTGASRLVWLGFWAALPMLAYGVVNVWPLVSPFRALAGLAERLRGTGRPMAYPERLGTWPSVVLLGAFIVLEAYAPGSGWLGRFAIVYLAFTLVGMISFGSRTWLAHAEVCERIFAWWASFAPGRLTSKGVAWAWPGHRLADSRGAGAAEATFAVGLLFGTTFDGLLRTEPGAALALAFGGLGELGSLVAVFAISFALFLAAFWGAVEAIRRATSTLAAPGELAGAFAVTLVPIGVGYHLAHNLAYVVEGIPLIVDALADPIGLNPGTASAWTVLSSQPALLQGIEMAFVIVGHVLAVVVAHRRALKLFPSKVQAVQSELPLTGLMVAYTLASLWIVSAGHAGGLVG